MAERYGRLDPWSSAAPIALGRARDMAGLLDRRARSEDDAAARTAYLDLLAIGPGEQILEVGCGHGIVLREVALRVGPAGRSGSIPAGPS